MIGGVPPFSGLISCLGVLNLFVFLFLPDKHLFMIVVGAACVCFRLISFSLHLSLELTRSVELLVGES